MYIADLTIINNLYLLAYYLHPLYRGKYDLNKDLKSKKKMFN